MNSDQQECLKALAASSLKAAEDAWDKIGVELAALAANLSGVVKASESIATQIPGYPVIEDGVPKVDEFVAVVVDMRNSTKHLLQSISGPKIEMLQRIYYETAALLPCLAKVIEWKGGSVTEFLGDGVLALFKASPSREQAIYASYRAAENCLLATNNVVNPLIAERYKLPPLEIGIGMSISKAVVTLVGTEKYKQPNVFGHCVFHATKLSGGHNVVVIDDALRVVWPKTDTGTLRFQKLRIREIDGYAVSEVSS